jgi:hypothetical protein
MTRTGALRLRSQKTLISVASAEMLLSIRSATAVSREYPRSRREAVKLAALGGREYGFAIGRPPFKARRSPPDFRSRGQSMERVDSRESAQEEQQADYLWLGNG